MKHFDPSKLAEDPATPATALAAAPRQFSATGSGGGYDATVAKGKRKSPVARARSEDAELSNTERLILGGSTRDLRRNFTIAAWLIRKHLDYVSTFSFQARCGKTPSLVKRFGKEAMDALDERIEELMTWWSRPGNFDAGGRHSQARFTRLAEASRVVDGDVLEVRRRDGTVQLVESDRIRNPLGTNAVGGADGALTPTDLLNVVNGVLIDPSSGAAKAYCVHKRDRTGIGMTFDKLVSAAYATLHGYFDRYDQVRGISPLAAAVNHFRDLYESFDYTLVKNKVAQLFALAIYRDKADQLGVLDEEEPRPVTDAGEAGESGDASADQPRGYKVDFGKGPVLLDLDPGDKAEVLESANPAADTQAFWMFIIQIALKALDIPYCFFDESHTNYSGLRVAWLQYDQSAESKRQDNRELLDGRTAWRLMLFVLDGTLELPDGMEVQDLEWEWVSRGVPWVDQTKEITADIMAIGAGLEDPQTILKARGVADPFAVIDRIAEFQAYAAEKGVTLSFVPPPLGEPPDPEDGAAGPVKKDKPPPKKNPPAQKKGAKAN